MDQAVEQDTETARRAWFRYQRITANIANRHGFAAHIGAGVFAALSPNNDYIGNLRDTTRLLAAAKAKSSIDDFKVSTYGSNKRKAWRIAHGEDPLELIVYPKTRNFYLNIINPLDTQPVTVDGHIYNAWRGERIPLTSAAQKFRRSLYEIVAEDIRSLVPNVVQGIIWFTWKRLHWIKHSDQIEFWAADMLAAGLGFTSE